MKVHVTIGALLAAQVAANSYGHREGPKSYGEDKKPEVNNSGVCSNKYTDEIRDYIVEKHNWARANLVPTEACNMRKVEWDESLAISASDWVENCQFEHYTENYAYGQNLMYGGHSLDKNAVDGWIKAWVEDEISEDDRCGNGMMDLDHASAVLWADTYLVGCASKMCPNGYLTACNYFNPGNMQGEKTYEPGTGCSKCPPQAPYCDASGKLCVAKQEYGDNYGPAKSQAPAPCPESKKPETKAPAPCPESKKPETKAPAPCPESKKPVVVPTPCPTNNVRPTNNVAPTPCPTNNARPTPCPTNNVRPTPCPTNNIRPTPCPTNTTLPTPCPSTVKPAYGQRDMC